VAQGHGLSPGVNRIHHGLELSLDRLPGGIRSGSRKKRLRGKRQKQKSDFQKGGLHGLSKWTLSGHCVARLSCRDGGGFMPNARGRTSGSPDDALLPDPLPTPLISPATVASISSPGSSKNASSSTRETAAPPIYAPLTRTAPPGIETILNGIPHLKSGGFF